MIAEDNPVNRQVAVAMLKKLGCVVETATNGAEAVDLWRGACESHAAAYDVILMDCQMPVLDGFGATRAIRSQEALEARTAVPIIAVTANALQEDRMRCLQAGMSAYLSKPYTQIQLANALRLECAASANVSNAVTGLT